MGPDTGVLGSKTIGRGRLNPSPGRHRASSKPQAAGASDIASCRGLSRFGPMPLSDDAGLEP